MNRIIFLVILICMTSRSQGGLCPISGLSAGNPVIWDYLSRPVKGEAVIRDGQIPTTGQKFQKVFVGSLSQILVGMDPKALDILVKSEQYIVAVSGGSRVVLQLRMYKDGIAMDDLKYPFNLEWNGSQFSIAPTAQYYNSNTNQFELYNNPLWNFAQTALKIENVGTLRIPSTRLPALIQALQKAGYDWPSDGYNQHGVLLHGGR